VVTWQYPAKAEDNVERGGLLSCLNPSRLLLKIEDGRGKEPAMGKSGRTRRAEALRGGGKHIVLGLEQQEPRDRVAKGSLTEAKKSKKRKIDFLREGKSNRKS